MLDKYTRMRTTGRQMIRAKTTNTIHKSINRGEGGVGVRAAATGGLRGPRDCRSDGAVGRSVGRVPASPSLGVCPCEQNITAENVVPCFQGVIHGGRNLSSVTTLLFWQIHLGYFMAGRARSWETITHPRLQWHPCTPSPAKASGSNVCKFLSNFRLPTRCGILC